MTAKKIAYKVKIITLVVEQISWNNFRTDEKSAEAQKRKSPERIDFRGFLKSKRQDLNLRPLRPERSALPN